MLNLNARNASLEDMHALLVQRQDVKHDLVVPATSIRSRDGVLHVKGSEQLLTFDGVTTVNGVYRPTDVADEGLAAKLGIPVGYLRKLRNGAIDLYDANVNGFLHGKTVRRATADESGSFTQTLREADARSFMLRTFRNPDGGEGIARAFVSDRYNIVDDLDALVAVLGAVKQMGTDIEVTTCDLTDRNMYVRVVAPGVKALASTLLAGYRSPFADPEVERQRNHGWSLGEARRAADNEGLATDEPVVFAGFEIRNSEVGLGAFSIVPVITVKVCKNGLTFTREAYRKTHLGAKLEHGTIQVSNETRRKNLELITSQTKDAVKTFLDVEWVQAKVAELEELSGVGIPEPEKRVRAVCKNLSFTEDEANGILGHFIRGGQTTAGGLMQAITSFSQTVANADRARHLDDSAVEALVHVAG
jgi:hypothetical protein